MIQCKFKRLKVKYSINLEYVIGLPLSSNTVSPLDNEDTKQTKNNPSKYIVKLTEQDNNYKTSHVSHELNIEGETMRKTALFAYNMKSAEQCVAVDSVYDFNVVLKKQDQYNYKAVIVDIEVVELTPVNSSDMALNCLKSNSSVQTDDKESIQQYSDTLASADGSTGWETGGLAAPVQETEQKVLVKASINIANMYVDAVHYYKFSDRDGSIALLFSITSDTTGKVSRIVDSMCDVLHQYRYKKCIFNLVNNFRSFAHRQLIERIKLIMQYSIDYSNTYMQYQYKIHRHWLVVIENVLYTQMMLYNKAYVRAYVQYTTSRIQQEEVHERSLITNSYLIQYEINKEIAEMNRLKYMHVKCQDKLIKPELVLPRRVQTYIKMDSKFNNINKEPRTNSVNTSSNNTNNVKTLLRCTKISGSNDNGKNTNSTEIPLDYVNTPRINDNTNNVKTPLRCSKISGSNNVKSTETLLRFVNTLKSNSNTKNLSNTKTPLRYVNTPRINNNAKNLINTKTPLRYVNVSRSNSNVKNANNTKTPLCYVNTPRINSNAKNLINTKTPLRFVNTLKSNSNTKNLSNTKTPLRYVNTPRINNNAKNLINTKTPLRYVNVSRSNSNVKNANNTKTPLCYVNTPRINSNAKTSHVFKIPRNTSLLRVFNNKPKLSDINSIHINKRPIH